MKQVGPVPVCVVFMLICVALIALCFEAKKSVFNVFANQQSAC